MFHMKLSIEPATVQDTDEILKLIRALAEYENLSEEVVATREKISGTLFGEKPFAECLLARLEKKVVGFALFFHNYSTFLGQPGIYLEDLFVQQEFRGKGIGGKLLQAVAQIAVQRNCGRLEWAVLDWNEPAINFYDSLDATAMREWFTYRLTGDRLKKVALGEK